MTGTPTTAIPGPLLTSRPELAGLPYRGTFGSPRQSALAGLALPPAPMPSHQGGRPLKAWRYVGVYGSDLMVCAASVRVGRARQAFWAVWDRRRGRLLERTARGHGQVELSPSRLVVRGRGAQVDLSLEEVAGIETVCRSGDAYAWTRKQGGIRAEGEVRLRDETVPLEARAVIDDTAGYYQRHTAWCWCAGVGTSADGREVAWNLVAGVNDPPSASERTVWIDGEPQEAAPVAFAPDLSRVGELEFTAEAVREHRENLLLVRSSYRQPFGRFSGRLPGGLELTTGFGVMEEHDVWW